MDAQIAKMEKKLADLVKNSPPASKSGLWETGNPHLTAWACQCGFQNFKSRTQCMKCKAKQQQAGVGAGGADQTAATAAGVATTAEVAFKPDEELVFWQGQLRSLKAAATGPGKTQLVDLAECKVAEYTTASRRRRPGCRKLPKLPRQRWTRRLRWRGSSGRPSR